MSGVVIEVKMNNIKELKNKVIIGDCVDNMKLLPDNSIDLIIADPPYNLSKGKPLKWDNSKKLNGMGGNWEPCYVWRVFE